MDKQKQIINFLKYLSLHGVSPKSLKYYKSDFISFLNWAGNKKINQSLILEYINSIRAVTPISTLKRRQSTLRSYASFMGFKKVSNTWQESILYAFTKKPRLQNFFHKLFFSRPNWYRTYHSYQLATYIHVAILVLFTSIAGFAVYDQIFNTKNNLLAFPVALTRPNRYLSFQGRLTSNVGNPITTATNLVFKLYDASTAGSELWTSGTCSITPDQDGIFSTLLGTTTNCPAATEIAATVFSENASVWVGVTVGADAEATPRVQIATVAYALNTETLQGYPAGTGTSTIPYIDSSGTVVLASASPKIQSTSGTFAVEGLAMTITTPNTSNGVITVNPDGVGTLDLTFEGTAAGLSANGFVNATNANITSGALYGGTVASAATGYNFIDFQGGVSPTSKFSVSSTGQITSASGLTIGTTSLSETTSPTDSGGYLVGVNDEFANSASTNVQAVLNDLDAAITTGATPKWNALTVPDGNLALAHAGYTTAFTFDSVTAADAFALSSSSLTTGTVLDLSSTSTAGGASGLSKVLDITRSGTNANASHTAYGLYSAVTNTGTTSTNVGGYFSASGATNNYGLIVANGNVGIGTTGPAYPLDIVGAFNQEGVRTYSNYYSLGSGSAGVWYEVGTITINAQYQLMNIAGTVNTDQGTGAALRSTNFILRVKQQAALGSAPGTSFTVEHLGAYDDFKAVITQNDGSATVVKFYKYSTTAYSWLSYSVKATGTAVFTPTTTPTTGLGAGTEIVSTGNYIFQSTGNFGIGTTGPDAKLDSLSTTQQLRLTYTDGTVYSGFTVDSSGNLTIDNTGTKTIIADDLQINGGDILTGNIAFTIGDATTDSITLTTDGTGNAELVLPNDSIGPNEILSTGQTDEYCLTYEGTGTTWEWQSCAAAGGGSWSALTVPTDNLSLAHAGYTTAFTFDSVTTADAFALSSSSLTTGTILDLSSTSTAGGASGSSKILDITRSGTNSNASHTAYGLYSAVTNTGTTSTNVGGYFSASGATNNYGLIVENGNVGIGKSTDIRGLLHVYGSGSSVSSVIGVQGDSSTTTPTATLSFRTRDISTDIGSSTEIVTGRDANYSSAANRSANLQFWVENADTLGEKMRITSAGNVGIGTTAPTTALHVGTGAETHTLSTGDALISSDLELDGVLYLDGGTISNSAGTASLVLSATPTTTANSLSAGNWLIENTANVGQAALIVNQTKSSDLFTASASGTPKFTIANTGAITSAIGDWTSQVADSSTAIGFTFNTSNTLSTQGSKLLSFQNLGTEKMYLDKDGNLYVSGTVVSGNGTSMLLTNKSGGTVASKAIVVLDTSNNTSFTTTTTPYSKSGFGVVIGVGLGVANDADGDGACDTDDICMVAYGGSVNVTVKNATTAVKGDYLFTSDTAGSAVASAKQYDGLIGIVDDTTNAASGYLKMIFKVQPQVTAAAAIDKTTKHNEYWLYADQYQAVGEGSNTDTNLLQRGLAFDTFTDSTKTDSANTTVSYTPEGRVGLIGGQTLATSTTDNDGQTYLGSNTVNDTYYYDRVRDSSPQVQVELGIDPNWYNGVTLSVATTSAQFSQNSVITQPNPNLSTTYNGSLIKVTGTDTTPRTIYITIKSPTTFDWTNYQGDAGTGVTITPGTAQTLGSTGVSATFTNARYNTGDVFKIASWFIEAESATRGAKQQFPERSNVIATASSVDIIDTDTQKLWMRFNTGNNGTNPYMLEWYSDHTGSTATMLNGTLYAGFSGGTAGNGMTTINFTSERAIRYRTSAAVSYSLNASISQRNTYVPWPQSNGWGNIVDNTVNDVSAAVIPNQPTQEVTVSGWGYIIGNGTGIVSESVNLPYKFNNVPQISISHASARLSTTPSTLADCNTNGTSSGVTVGAQTTSITNSNFNAVMTSNQNTYFSASYYFCYTWTATGQVSPRQYVGVGTNGGTTVINETDQSAVNFTWASYNTHKVVKLTSNDILYYNINDGGSNQNYVISVAGIAGYTTSQASLYSHDFATNTIPAPIGGAAAVPASLQVTEGTSTIDGKSNTIYYGNSAGVSVIQESYSGGTGTDEYGFQAGNSSVKYYTKDYISEEMVGDIRGMWPLSANGAISMSDASVKANTLTNNGTATAVTGVRGVAASFNGTSQYLTRAYDTDFNLGTYGTFGAWVKTTSSAATQYIISQPGADNDAGGISFTPYRLEINTGIPKATWNNSSSYYSATSSKTINDGNWHYVTTSYNGSVITLYVDGQIVATTAMTGSVSTVTDDRFFIGANWGYTVGINGYFNGSIDEPFVTATALTAGQIKHMYEVGYRALQSHGTGLGGGSADTNQQLGFISTGTNTVGVAIPDWNNQYMYVGTNSTTLGALSKIQLNSDTNIKTYNSSANVPTGGALLIDEDVTSLAVGYNLVSAGSAASGVKTMGVDNNATATSGNFIGKTITTAESFNQAYLWAQYVTDSSDASNTIQVWASNDGGSNYYQCNLTNTDTSQSPSEYEYFCQFNTAGSSLKTKFVMARGSTKTNTYVVRYGISWIDSNAVAGSANGSGLFTGSNASVANGSYIDVAHNQNSNDLVTNGWVYNSSTNQWEDINNATASAQIQNTFGGNLVKNYPSLEKADSAQPEWWEEQDANVTLTEEDATGESIPDKTERVLKIVNGASGANKYVYERFTHADENLLDDSTTLVSAGAWVYTASAGTVTLELYNNGGSASLGTATTTTTGSWQYLRVEGKTIGTTSTDLRIYHSANSATMYATMPQFNVGPQVQSWSERGTKMIDIGLSAIYTGDPGGAVIDHDLTTLTSGLTVKVQLETLYSNSVANTYLYAYRKGGSGGLFSSTAQNTTGGYQPGTQITFVDDQQVITTDTTAAAGDTEYLNLYLDAYWEWDSGSPGPVNSPFYIQQVDANTARLYNYSGATQNLRLDVITGGLGRNAGTVSLAPAAADVDSQSNTNSIWINKTGSGGNLLKLQTSGADVLSLTGAGLMTLTGNFLPGTDNTYALGSTSNRWKDLFLGPTSLHVSSTTGTSGVGANYVDATLGYSSNALTLATAVTGTVSGGGSINLTSGLALGNTTTSAFNFTTSADFGATDEVLQIGDSAANFMTVLGNGNVGIGTTNPAGRLDVFTDANQAGITTKSTYSDYATIMSFLAAGGSQKGSITGTPTSVAYNTTSDLRLKENIIDTSLGLDALKQISIKDFNFISDPEKMKTQGFIAQELYKIYPYAVTVGGDDPNKNPWGVDYGRLTPLIIKSIQELNAKVNSIASQIQNAVFPEVKTSLISPIANTDLIIDLQPDNSEVATQLIIKGENDEVVTSFDAYGNATVSGTLYANNIESQRLEDIEELLREVETNQILLTEAASWNTDTATASADLSTTNLFVTGQAAITSLFVSDNFTTKNINSLTEPLSIQSLASAPLEIMAGKIIIDTDGNTKFLGNVEIAGDLKINNIIVANNIDPVATESGSIIEGEINSNATAGTATLPAGLTELIIKNEKLKINSLIYVTPVSSTQNKVLYVKSKDVGVFTIGFNEAIDTDVEFNWWIIELQGPTLQN